MEGLIVEWNLLPAIAEALPRECARIVKAVATDVAAMAAANAAHDTGFMASSVYVVTKDSSTYGEGFLAPPRPDDLLPEIPRPTDSLEADIAAAARYHIYVEMGTRYAPAQPFLGPAAARAMALLEARFAGLEHSLAIGGR